MRKAKAKLKLVGTDAQKVFVKQVVEDCVTAINAEYGDLSDDQPTNHVINSIMNFIETAIATSSKFKDEKFDKKKILYAILNEVYKNTKIDDDNFFVEEAVRMIFDSDLVKVTATNFFLKYGKKAVSMVKDLLV